MEYARSDSVANHGQALNAAKAAVSLFSRKGGGWAAFVIETIFSSMSEFNTIETLVEVVWVDVQMVEKREDYRAGVKFVDISPETLKIDNFFEESLRINDLRREIK